MKHTYTAHIHTVRHGLNDDTFVNFNNRQNAISYVWPFYKRTLPTQYKYDVSIIVDRGTDHERTLYPPEF